LEKARRRALLLHDLKALKWHNPLKGVVAIDMKLLPSNRQSIGQANQKFAGSIVRDQYNFDLMSSSTLTQRQRRS